MDKKYTLAMKFNNGHTLRLPRGFNGYSKAYIAAMDISLASYVPVILSRLGDEVARFEQGEQTSGEVRT